MNTPPLHRHFILRAFAVLAILAMALVPTTSLAQTREQMRATFLLNFAEHVAWPEITFVDENAPLVIGVVESKIVANAVEQKSRGRTINGRQIAVRDVVNPKDSYGCHIVYVPKHGDAAAIIEANSGKPVLTVGEHPDFTDMGGMIKLVEANNSLSCSIKIATAVDAGLDVNSTLITARR